MEQTKLPRFIAVDGLRCWMAWVVVVSHVVQQSGLRDAGRVWHAVFDAGNWGVGVFIIISGFVITHLLLMKQRPYLAYIIPRFMRLAPAYLICTALGGLAYIFAANLGGDNWFRAIHGELYETQTKHLAYHVLAHLTLLQGIIPNDVLPLSQYVFLPPAWSVSLEWQFYLVAPLIIWWCRNSTRCVMLVIGVALMAFVYSRYLSHHWRQPSALIGSAQFFLIGIASRYAAPRLAGKVTNPATVAVAALAVGLAVHQLAVGIWLATLAFLFTIPTVTGAADSTFVRLIRIALESKVAIYLAERSYSTYLLHWPIMMLLGAVFTRYMGVTGQRLAVLLLLTIPVTLIMQEALFRLIEEPGRLAGKRWATRIDGKSVREVAVEKFGTGPEGKHV